MHRRAHPGRVERRRKGDAIAGDSKHLGRMAGDGDLVGERSGGGQAMASAVPVVDLLETGVTEELRGEFIGSALGNDAPAELGRDGDRGRHGSLRGRGSEGPVGSGPVGRASGKSEVWSGRESLVEAARWRSAATPRRSGHPVDQKKGFSVGRSAPVAARSSSVRSSGSDVWSIHHPARVTVQAFSSISAQSASLVVPSSLLDLRVEADRARVALCLGGVRTGCRRAGVGGRSGSPSSRPTSKPSSGAVHQLAVEKQQLRAELTAPDALVRVLPTQPRPAGYTVMEQ